MRTLPSLPAVLLAAALAPAQAKVVKLPAAADATVDANNPTTNAGASPHLDFGKHYRFVNGRFTVWFKRGLIRFDLGPLRSRARPLRARLLWYQDRARTRPAGCLPVDLHRVTRSWSETGVTWANRPAHDPKVIASASVGGWNCSGWKIFDVSALVRDWLDGKAPNLGMVIKDPRESRAGAARPGMGHSRESTRASLRPYLEVSWWTAYGRGCAPAGRKTPTLEMSAGSPARGQRFTLTARGLPAGRPAALLFSAARRKLNLGFAGFPACDALTGFELVLGTTSAAAGRAAFSFAVPRDPFLRGKDFFAQAAGLDGKPDLHLSHGFQVRVF